MVVFLYTMVAKVFWKTMKYSIMLWLAYGSKRKVIRYYGEIKSTVVAMVACVFLTRCSQNFVQHFWRWCLRKRIPYKRNFVFSTLLFYFCKIILNLVFTKFQIIVSNSLNHVATLQTFLKFTTFCLIMYSLFVRV